MRSRLRKAYIAAGSTAFPNLDPRARQSVATAACASANVLWVVLAELELCDLAPKNVGGRAGAHPYRKTDAQAAVATLWRALGSRFGNAVELAAT